MTTINATLKFYDTGKGFGFASTSAGDVRIGAAAIRPDMLADLQPGAKLTLEALRAEKGMQAKSVLSVTLPYREGTLKRYDAAKGFGFIKAEGGDVFLHQSVANAAGVEPWDGLLVQFLASPGKDGKLRATKVVFPTLAAEIAALTAEDSTTVAEAAVVVEAPEAPALADYVLGEELAGTVKWFKSLQGWGYIIVAGKQGDLFVHKTGVRSELTLTEGLQVICRVGQNPKGFCAELVRLPGEPVVVPTELVEKPVRPHHVVRKRRPESAVAAEAPAPVATTPRERVTLDKMEVSTEVGKPKPKSKRKPKRPSDKVFASASPPGGGEDDRPFGKLAALKAAMNGGAEAPQVH